jgi:acetyl-CoA acetyltransferase
VSSAYVIDAVRTPFGRYAAALSGARPDDLAAHVVRALVDRQPKLDPGRIDDVIFGDANQAGEDNRNVAGWPRSWRGCPPPCPGPP